MGLNANMGVSQGHFAMSMHHAGGSVGWKKPLRAAQGEAGWDSRRCGRDYRLRVGKDISDPRRPGLQVSDNGARCDAHHCAQIP